MNVAREVSADWILPLALYRCCTHMETSELAMGDLCTRSKLNPQDSELCLEAALDFRVLQNSRVLDFLLRPSSIPGCLSVQQCMSTRMKHRQLHDRMRRHQFPLNIWGDRAWTNLFVCDPCMTYMKQSYAAAVQTFWDGLPAVFGLPSWGSLDTLKGAALQ